MLTKSPVQGRARGVAEGVGCPFHGGFGVLPGGYDVLVTGNSTGNATLAALEASMACVP